MAIAYKSQGAGAGTETSGATLNVPCPATVDANDILIAHVIHTGTTTAPSTPAGWSLLSGPNNVGTTATARHWCFGKLAIGNEDGTNINFGTAGGTNGRAGRIYSFSGYISGTLADVVPAASFWVGSHATDPQGPFVTTTVAGARAVALFCQDDNNTGAAITGMTGGTWVENVAEYSDATWGPQGIVLYINSAIPTADPGTISGGAQVATNDEAGTIGFEIRPEVPAVTGTSATTNANDSSSASGAVTVSGSSATTNAADTSSASGTVTVTGTSATTNANDASSASGEVSAASITGTSATTNAADASSAAGLVTTLGTSAAVNADDASSATGKVAVIGTAAAVNADDVASASGEVWGGPVAEEIPAYRGGGLRRRQPDDLDPREVEARYELAELRRKAADERRALAEAEAPAETPAAPEPTPASVPSAEGARAPVLPAIAPVDPTAVIDEQVAAFTKEQARTSARAAAQVAELLAEAKRRADEELMLIAVALAVEDED